MSGANQIDLSRGTARDPEEEKLYLWQALDKATQRRDFPSVQYWVSQILIHRSRKFDVEYVIPF